MNNEKILSNEELLEVTGGKSFVTNPKFKIGQYRSLYAVEPVFDPDFGICYPEYAVAPISRPGHELLTPDYGIVPVQVFDR